MNKPIISKNFTIEDIHKIREFHTEERNEIGKTEYNKRLNQKVAEFLGIGTDKIKTKAAAVR